MKILDLATSLALLALVGCNTMTVRQTCRFVDDEGRSVDVEYGILKDEHVTTFTSPVNGKEMEYSSKLAARIRSDEFETTVRAARETKDKDGRLISKDHVDVNVTREEIDFKGYQSMNFTGSGTLYESSNEEWRLLATGLSCQIFRRVEVEGEKRRVYRLVFAGSLAAPPKESEAK